VTTFTQQIAGIRGRGARTNASGRYESATREAFDDGWTPDDAEPVQLATTVTPESVRQLMRLGTLYRFQAIVEGMPSAKPVDALTTEGR